MPCSTTATTTAVSDLALPHPLEVEVVAQEHTGGDGDHPERAVGDEVHDGQTPPRRDEQAGSRWDGLGRRGHRATS